MKIKNKMFIMLTVAIIMQISLFTTTYAKDEETLIITGEGVTQTIEFRRTELEAMQKDIIRSTYSTVNNWPTKKIIASEGIPLELLLKKAGIKKEAKIIKITASDGYFTTFTKKELIDDTRYTYPQILKDSTVGAQIIKPVIALRSGDGTKGYDKMTNEYFFLNMGQRVITEQNNQWYVKYVSKIEVLNTEPEKWESVTTNIKPNNIKSGDKIELGHPNFDLVKIYYTIDGTEPTLNSKVYNMSATYWQPELNLPITLGKNTVIKAIAIGVGKENSDVVTFDYTVDKKTELFSDISNHLWAENAIETLAQKKVIEGTGNNKFNPEGTLTRAQFAKMIVLSLGQTASKTDKSTFDDIKKGEWYTGFVNKAVEINLLHGVGGGNFKPSDHITKEQMIAVIIRAMGKEKDAEKRDINLIKDISSSSQITPWAKPYVAYAYEQGLIETGHVMKSGSDGKWILKGTEKVTRAEAAETIYRMLNKLK